MTDDPDRSVPEPKPVRRDRFAHGVITGRMLTVLVVSLIISIIALAVIYAQFVDW